MWPPQPNPWSMMPLPPTRSYQITLPNFQQNWPFPANFYNPYRKPYQWLPRLFQAAYYWRVSVEAAGDAFARMSDDTIGRGSFPGLNERDLRQVYFEIMSIVQYHQDRQSVSSHIRQQLGMMLAEESYRGRHFLRGYPSRAAQLFRAYAEISIATMSRPLGSILAEFFEQHLHVILVDDVDDLAIWSHSIWRSHMREDDKHSFLAPIVEACPDLIPELRRSRILAAQDLWPVLADIANRLGINAGRRGRSRRRPSLAMQRSIMRPGGRGHLIGGWDTVESGSLSPSPSRGSVVRDMAYRSGDLIVRPVSAPGRHSILRQADRVIELAEDTVDEAQALRDIARR